MKSPEAQVVSGAWKQFRGKLQEKWGELTNDELDRLEGQRDQIVGYIERKTGESRQAIHDTVDRAAQQVKYNF